MKRIAMAVAAAFGLAVAGTAQASEELAKKSGCLTCHNVTGAKKIGPSLKDSAAKVKGKPDAEATLLAALADKKKHPSSKASADDQKTLVKWMLSM